MKAASKVVPAIARRKPPAAGQGRKKGTPNKTTRALKEAILLAAEKVGSNGRGSGGLTGYLVKLAKTEPTSFASLLGKVLPLTLQGPGADGEHIAVTRIELVPMTKNVDSPS